jgi:hypothetical protein
VVFANTAPSMGSHHCHLAVRNGLYEADAIAARRSSSLEHGFLRESNTVVNVLLRELETFSGVIFCNQSCSEFRSRI